MNQTEVNHEQIAEWRKLRGKGMVSAVGEYTPDEFWLLLDNFERLERDLAKANADKAVLVEALDAIANQPIGSPTASHAEVLCGIEAIARAALSLVQA